MKLHNALIVQPLSAAKMAHGLNPDRVLGTYFGNISDWVVTPTNDVAIVFTTGLYQNNPSDTPIKQRMSLLQREAEWRNRFDRLLNRRSDQTINGFPLMREGFQMASWDQCLVKDWNEFYSLYEKVKSAYRRDSRFQTMIDNEIRGMGRELTESNVAFIIEEIALTALWLQGGLPVGKSLRTEDKLDALHIVYPSPAQKFMIDGLKYILKDKRALLPLVWLDTSDQNYTIPSTFRFGRDAPAMCRA